MMAARANITDRAHRYRANKLMPRGRKVCAKCGSTSNIVPDHVNGVPDDTRRANLQWLCKSCNTAKGAAFAKAGKGRLTHQYNPVKGVPTFEQYVWAVANHSLGSHDEGGKIIHATPLNKRSEYARRIWSIRRERGTDSDMPDWARNPVCRAAIKRVNPSEGAARAFEEFHGFPPEEVVTIRKEVHYHEHLAAAGKLPFLDVWGIDERGHKIKNFHGTILCFNEDMNQLFAEGGDQAVDLAQFGIDRPHELETLGKITDIGYKTTKTHLGSEGGTAVYVHKFRSTNKNGKHVIVRIARYPDLIYDVRNEQLLFSGGSYEILREGINK